MSDRIILCRQASGNFSTKEESEAVLDKHSFEFLMDNFQKIERRPLRYFKGESLPFLRRIIMRAMNSSDHNIDDLNQLAKIVSDAQKNSEIIYYLPLQKKES